MMKPEVLENVYRQWVRPYIGSCQGKQIGVDGKTIRGASSMGDINIHMEAVGIGLSKGAGSHGATFLEPPEMVTNLSCWHQRECV